MKVKVTIEETISQTFEVEVNSMETAYDEIRSKYKNEELVLTNPCLLCVSAAINEGVPGVETEFVDLHI